MASVPPIPQLDLWAKLAIDFDDARLLLVAEGNKIILGIPDQRTLDKLTALGDKGKKSSAPKPAGGGPLASLQPLHDAVKQLGLVLDLRVGGKTYAEFGIGNGPRITAAAVLGKIGSFFGGGSR
jgi:hypothetical protein